MPKSYNNRDGTRYGYRSFYMNENDLKMMRFLSEFYGINPSAVIRKLLSEAYTVCKLMNPKDIKND